MIARLERACARYVGFAARRPRILVAAAALAAIAGAAGARTLELRTDMTELLPADDPAAVALREVGRRQRSSAYLAVLLRSPDASANRRFADALRDALAPGGRFTEIETAPDGELAAFAARQRWLYVEQRDLDEGEALLDRIVALRSSPLAVELDDPEAELRALRGRLDARLPPPAPLRFEAEGGREVGLRLWRARDGIASRGDRSALDAVRAAVATLGPTRFHPSLVVEYTGPIAQAIAEQDGIRDDLTLATAIVVAMVLAALGLYFRRPVLVAIVCAPALLGVLAALCLAAATTGSLNLNTAFLVSIIVGNGINAPIVLLARYREEREAGAALAAALAVALRATILGTGLATAAAGLSYGSLLLTRFRGFSQFGLLGGAGMALVWIASALVVPPLVCLCDRGASPRRAPRHGAFARLVSLGARRPRLACAVVALSLLAAARPIARWARDPIEWDFHRLRTEAPVERARWEAMERLGMGNVGAGFIGNTAVALAEHPGQDEPIAEALRRADAARGPARLFAAVRTVGGLLPPAQEARLAQLARLRRKLDRHRDVLSAELRREVDAWRPPEGLRALGVDDLPRKVREAFTERDGTRGRLVGIDADYRGYSDWDGHDLLRMADALHIDALGRRWVAASAATIFASMLAAILRDGPRLVLAAAGAVAALMLLAFGARGAALVLGALAVGVLWLAAACALLGLKINFMNFVALPITLGVGADYAANVWARLRQEPPGRVAQALPRVAAAVALCSLTTIIGYSSLLLSRNPALRSFGLVADLGEAACLAAALVVLPAASRLTRDRRAVRTSRRGP